jgi:hypothetical protein
MASWGKTDAYTAAPLWALLQVNKAPTLTNMGPEDSAAVALLFENAAADDFITGKTVGLFNYSASETQSGKVAHSGWILKSTGKSGSGRNGRISYETLVCLTSNS